MKIKIKTGSIGAEAELYNNKTAKAIYNKLPIIGFVNRWGDEIYFEIPLHIDLDDSAKEIVEKGNLGFWPSGDAFCIFFGKTPASKGNEIKPASAVNVFGKVVGDSSIFKKIKDGEKITIEKM